MQKILVVVLTLMLTACASGTKFSADVARFHRLPAELGGGRSILINPADPALEGLEFSQYANLIGARLQAFGFAPPAGNGASDLVALVGYDVMLRQQVREERSPATIGIGVGSGGRHGGVSLGTAFGVGEPRSNDEYLANLNIQIRDRLTGNVVYEARASGSSRIGELSTVMPYLLDAVFAEFPGPDGQTTHYQVSIPPASRP